jgi:hypothetical protein
MCHLSVMFTAQREKKRTGWLGENQIEKTLDYGFDIWNRETLFKVNGKVIGEFTCYVVDISHRDMTANGLKKWEDVLIPEYFNRTCLTLEEFKQYAKDCKEIFEWHISDLVIYDKPRELGEFCKVNTSKNPIADYYWREDHAITRPPQSYCYIESEEKTNA